MRSVRTTASLISILLLLFFLGLVVPQKAMFESREHYAGWKERNPAFSRIVEVLDLNTIYVAPVTLFFLSLFFLNLVVVLGNRIPLVLRRAYLVRDSLPLPDPEEVRSHPHAMYVKVLGKSAQEIAQAVRQFFRSRFWFPVGPQDGRVFLAVRNRYSPIGFLLFHSSFLLCLIGGLFIMYTRFAGELVLTEGEEFFADMSRFKRIVREPKLLQELPLFGLQLQKASVTYDRGVPTAVDVRVLFHYKGERKEETMRINEPVERGPLLILASELGVSPLLVLRSPGGQVVDGGYVALNVLKGDEDSFVFNGSSYRHFVKFFADYAVRDGREVSATKELKNPVVRLRTEDPSGKVVSDGLLRIGQSAAVPHGAVAFEDVRYWIGFQIVREYGNIPLFAGFLLGAVGLVMRLIFYQKTIAVVVEEEGHGSVVILRGRSEFYPAHFAEEMKALVNDLEAALAGQ